MLYLVLKWIHVLAAALLVGQLLLVHRLGAPMVREELPNPARLLERLVKLSLAPAILVLFATGVAMSGAPLDAPEHANPRGAWVIVGMALWVLVAAVAGGYLWGLVPRLREAADAGDATGVARVWRRARGGALAAFALASVTILWMVLQPEL